MRRLAAVALFCLVSLLPVANSADEAPLPGYSAEQSRAELEAERAFRAVPSPENMKEYMVRLSARPHHVGSPYDKDNAEWLLAKFKEWGLDAHIETFDVLFPTPKVRVLEMLAPVKFTAKLHEPVVPVDPTSGQQDEQLPTYNAYSIDGDVTAPLVFANYGLPEDYEKLDRLGVSVKGAIVIAKYGHSWRGIKPKVAAEHGAIGCLIYSDPRDDGYFVQDTFPNGPMRPLEGVQRGSVMDFPSSWPGDPLTPNVGATPEAKRLPMSEAKSLTKIPVLPISYGDAQPLLAALAGPMAPEAWRGSLAIPYHVGPGPAKVHLKVAFNWDTKPVRDIIVKIAGSAEPDQWVVRGNHYDAWVNGAEDPISGQVTLLEEARALGQMLKQGWRPRRTIIYCAWDGEEPMLLGSTEWAEAHADELAKHAVMYINTDGNTRGFLNTEGSPSLEAVVNDVAREIQDPETGMTVWERRRLNDIHEASKDQRDEIRRRKNIRLDALGSGSDYTAFIDHLAIPSLNTWFDGEDDQGIYHSIYDDYFWYSHFSDNTFVFGRALSQVVGSMIMRMADAEVLPYDFNALADTVHHYTSDVENLLKDKQDEIRERNTELDEGVFKASNDPRHPILAPPREEVPPHLDFAPLDNAADALTRSADRYQRALAGARAKGGLSPEAVTALNQKLIEAERRLTSADGLPRRPWYHYLLFAPGVYTGYAAKTLPGVREAIEQKRWDEANQQIGVLAQALRSEAELLDSASSDLEKPVR